MRHENQHSENSKYLGLHQSDSNTGTRNPSDHNHSRSLNPISSLLTNNQSSKVPEGVDDSFHGLFNKHSKHSANHVKELFNSEPKDKKEDNSKRNKTNHTGSFRVQTDSVKEVVDNNDNAPGSPRGYFRHGNGKLTEQFSLKVSSSKSISNFGVFLVFIQKMIMHLKMASLHHQQRDIYRHFTLLSVINYSIKP